MIEVSPARSNMVTAFGYGAADLHERSKRRDAHVGQPGGYGALEYFSQQLINGLTLVSIYGLIAIGYTMVHGIIGMINFARNSGRTTARNSGPKFGSDHGNYLKR